MIYVSAQGRLGNQLFEYAFAKHLKNKYYSNERILFNFAKLNDPRNGFENSLKYFNVKDLECTDKIKINILQNAALYIFLGIRKIFASVFKFDLMQRYNFEKHFYKTLNFFGIYVSSCGFYNEKKSKFKNKIVIGNFESAKFFDDVKEQLIKEYTPVKEKKAANKKLYNEIEKNESVCVTIRRGDFLSDKYKKEFFVCDTNYFNEAIKKMQKMVPNAKFFIFSDDVEWCKKNINVPEGTMYESGKDPVWEKLRLMYSCKHFIISNSTFSWWAQCLSRNKEKIVIAPKNWKNENMPRDIYDESWELI